MPKNTKKEQIKQAIIEDKLTLVNIAREYNVKQPYISQIKIELDRDRYFSFLKFMYNIMNTKMIFNKKPTKSEKEKIKEVSELL